MTSSETIEKLARELAEQKFLNELRACKTLEDFQELTRKYEGICGKHQ